jgi:hypothetical protein
MKMNLGQQAGSGGIKGIVKREAKPTAPAGDYLQTNVYTIRPAPTATAQSQPPAPTIKEPAPPARDPALDASLKSFLTHWASGFLQPSSEGKHAKRDADPSLPGGGFSSTRPTNKGPDEQALTDKAPLQLTPPNTEAAPGLRPIFGPKGLPAKPAWGWGKPAAKSRRAKRGFTFRGFGDGGVAGFVGRPVPAPKKNGPDGAQGPAPPPESKPASQPSPEPVNPGPNSAPVGRSGESKAPPPKPIWSRDEGMVTKSAEDPHAKRAADPSLFGGNTGVGVPPLVQPQPAAPPAIPPQPVGPSTKAPQAGSPSANPAGVAANPVVVDAANKVAERLSQPQAAQA